jgi:glutamate racemase
VNDSMRNYSIGVFDSGIGGLTVVKELVNIMPSENIIYFGDTARLPYGSKSNTLIKRFSLENAIFLNTKNVKIIVIACNTASAASAEYLRSFIKVPVIGVIECGASSAVRTTKNKRIGVIGTKSTIRSGAYTNAIRNLDCEIEVFESPTPLLVHLVEEDWVEKDITKSILKEYLEPLLKHDIDTLVLGCTHYPILRKQIQTLADKVKLIDSSREVAQLSHGTLKMQNILIDSKKQGVVNVFLSDMHPDFLKWSKELLGMEINANLINIEDESC